MSKEARRKRLMRLKGEKRDKKPKLKGLSAYATPRFRPPEMFANYYAGQETGSFTSQLAENDPWLGLAELPDENIEAAGAGLQTLEEELHGPETDRVEAEPAGREDPGAGVELEEREIQSRAGDNPPLDEEGTAQGEPADD